MTDTTARPRRMSNRRANTPMPAAAPEDIYPSNQKAGAKSAKEILYDNQITIQRAIPKEANITAEGLIVSTLREIWHDRRLASCTNNSVLDSTLVMAHLGIDFSGEQAFLIPFDYKYIDPETREERHLEWRANIILGYPGLVNIAGRFGYTMDVQAVHANEQIDIDLGTINVLHHKPLFFGRGDLTGAYCVLRDQQNFTRHIALVYQEEIEQLKRDTPAWRNYEGQMLKKCAAKRSFNWIPKSNPVLRLVDEVDQRSMANEYTGDLARENSSERPEQQ